MTSARTRWTRPGWRCGVARVISVGWTLRLSFDSRVISSQWPRKQGDVGEIRETADASAGPGVQEIVDHYEKLIRELDHPPVLWISN